MKRFFALISVLCIALTAAADNNNNTIVMKAVKCNSEFTKIAVGPAIKVFVEDRTEGNIIIRATKSIIDDVKLEVSGDELSVSYKKDMHFNKKFSAGFFGGEGFIMQRLSGNGVAFVEFDGHVVEYELRAGQSIVVDTGYLAAMDATCNMEIQTVPGVKNALFGGEGLFNTVITGPGRIYLQSMPIYQTAQALTPYININTGKRFRE